MPVAARLHSRQQLGAAIPSPRIQPLQHLPSTHTNVIVWDNLHTQTLYTRNHRSQTFHSCCQHVTIRPMCHACTQCGCKLPQAVCWSLAVTEQLALDWWRSFAASPHDLTVRHTCEAGTALAKPASKRGALTSSTLSEMTSCLAQARLSSSEIADFSGCKLSTPLSPRTLPRASCHCSTVCLQPQHNAAISQTPLALRIADPALSDMILCLAHATSRSSDIADYSATDFPRPSAPALSQCVLPLRHSLPAARRPSAFKSCMWSTSRLAELPPVLSACRSSTAHMLRAAHFRPQGAHAPPSHAMRLSMQANTQGAGFPSRDRIQSICLRQACACSKGDLWANARLARLHDVCASAATLT